MRSLYFYSGKTGMFEYQMLIISLSFEGRLVISQNDRKCVDIFKSVIYIKTF